MLEYKCNCTVQRVYNAVTMYMLNISYVLSLMNVVPSTSTAVQFSIESSGQVAAIFYLEPFLTNVAVP